MAAKRVASFLLFVIIFASCISTSAAAATPLGGGVISEHNKTVEHIVSELEERYNIDISYPIRHSGYAAIGPPTLDTLNSALEFITPEMVREISEFYRVVKGTGRLEIAFEYPPLSSSDTNSALAAFNSAQAKLRIFIPHSNGSMLISGTNPTVIVHEMGHAFHHMLESRVGGAATLQKMWENLSAVRYNYSRQNNTNPNNLIFATAYASTDYGEDFAETFAMLFTANRPGLGVSARFKDSNGIATVLSKKADFLTDMVAQHINNNEAALENIALIYSTPTRVVYNGIAFSGNELQYIGFSEPNGIYKAIEDNLSITTKNSQWIKQLGAWWIESHDGYSFYAFPGGAYTTIENN